MSGDEKSVSRREFLRDSAAAAAALSLGLEATHAAQQAENPAVPGAEGAEPVPFGIIGTGTQGSRLLEQALRVPGARCTAVCDIYPRHLSRGLEIARGAEGYTDYRRMLERKDIQAVIIATPLSLHAPMALGALDAGKHVFVEKTMAYSVAQARAIVRRSRETKRHVQVGHQRRYSPLYHHALEQVRRGLLGRITAVRAFWNRNGSWRRSLPPEEREKWERILNWRLYREYSGGLMAELACHQFDAVNWFLQARPISVIGVAGLDWYRDGRDVWDNVNVVYEYPGGVKVTYQSLCTNAFDDEGCVFLGDKGTLVLSESAGFFHRESQAEEVEWAAAARTQKDERGRSLVVLDSAATTKEDKRQRTAGVPLASAGGAVRNNYFLEMLDFFEVVRTDRKPFADALTGLEVTATVIRANEAMEKGSRYRFKKSDFEVA